MWRDLAAEVNLELAQLQRLLTEYATLLATGGMEGEDPVTTLALAGVLQSFYHGVENIFGRIARRVDNVKIDGPAWHRELLDAMAAPTANRPAVISEALRDQLEEFLRFRHMFRHAYSFNLRAGQLAPLAESCPACFAALAADVRDFLARGAGGEP
ncbi:MAG TPA: hypothetical protein VM695_06805 [Phycisphaerae bacterium]|nr:hypothetical protein [Phycisphaerae bacterium]